VSGGDNSAAIGQMEQVLQEQQAQMQELQAAAQQLQAENEALKREDAAKIAKIESDHALSMEKMDMLRQQAMDEADLKRKIAQDEFDLKLQKMERELALSDKIKTAEFVQRDRHREMDRPEPSEAMPGPEAMPEHMQGMHDQINELTQTVQEFIKGNGKKPTEAPQPQVIVVGVNGEKESARAPMVKEGIITNEEGKVFRMKIVERPATLEDNSTGGKNGGNVQ
jgi:hypothetical protein